jgi:hypothetical protein
MVKLVLIHGRERAREMVPQRQRPPVDIAAEVMADESQRIGISYTGFCLTSLPHKRLPDATRRRWSWALEGICASEECVMRRRFGVALRWSPMASGHSHSAGRLAP